MDTTNKSSASNGTWKTEYAACKEEKQKYNEDIFVLESSSLSSETGSWESVFPPKPTTKDVTTDFIEKEKEYASEVIRDTNFKGKKETGYRLGVVKPCFIDASTLVDDEDIISNKPIPPPTLPIPCTSSKRDEDSPNPEDDDSLADTEVKEEDSMSPTLYDLTPGYEDSISNDLNKIHNNDKVELRNEKICENNVPKSDDKSVPPKISLNMLPDMRLNTDIETPYNSIMSLRTSSLKLCDVSDSNQSSIDLNVIRNPVNDPAAVFERHPDLSSRSTGSQSDMGDDVSIASYYVHDDLDKPIRGGRGVSAWVIDVAPETRVKRPRDKAYERIATSDFQREASKSRSSLASDSSERSSHKFYIDLSSLPDDVPPEKPELSSSEKKNIFSMYIDLGDNTKSKVMPTRLSSSLRAKKKSESSVSTCTSEYFSLSNEKTTPRSNKSGNNDNFTNEIPNPGLSCDIDQTWTFEQYEKLCTKPNFQLSEVLGTLERMKKNKNPKQNPKQKTPQRQSQNRVTNSVQKSTKSSTKAAESSNGAAAAAFVRLSDLDNPLNRPLQLKIDDKNDKPERMTKSIPEDAWDDNNLANLIGSFHSENTLSLNRLFPHLRGELSKSLPGSLTAGRWPPSTGSQSPDGSTDTNTSYRYNTDRTIAEDLGYPACLITQCKSKLGQDLLRMFLEKIAPDVVVEAAGVRIKAHKCILASRCQYFAGILSGGLVQSSGNVIIMPPFSYSAVHFALCHIYSGISVIPESVNIVELASLTDMLSLEGLKEAITTSLINKYCHQFHEPCTICIAGVLQCFPLSTTCGLEELYNECLSWITRHFVTVWPNRSFATLSKTLLDKCYLQRKEDMTVENIFDIVCGCSKILRVLPSARWTEPVEAMCRRLTEAASQFAAPQLSDVLTEVLEQPPDTYMTKLRPVLDLIQSALEKAPPEQICYVYEYLSRSLDSIMYDLQHKQMPHDTDPSKSPLTIAFVYDLTSNCEAVMVKNAVRVASCQAFKKFPVHLRIRMHQLGCMVYNNKTSTPTARSTPTPSKSRNSPANESLNKIKNSLFVPYMHTPVLNNDASKVKKTENKVINNKPRSNRPVIRMTKAQQQRAKHNQEKVNQMDKKLVVQKNRAYKGECAISNSRTTSQDRLTGSQTAEPSNSSLSGSQTSNIYATFTKRKHYLPQNGDRSSYNNAVTKHPTRLGGAAIKSRIPAPTSNVASKRNAYKVPSPGQNKPGGTFMIATKASQAKTVTKTTNSPKTTKSPVANKTQIKQNPPVMQRSDTFLKNHSSFEETS